MIDAIERLPRAFGGVALVVGTGWLLARRVRALRRCGPIERLGWGFALGAGALGASLLLASAAGLPLGREVTLVLAGAIALAAWAAPGPVYEVAIRRPSGAEAAAGLLAGGVSLLVLAFTHVAPVSDWDGRMTWMPLARWMRADATAKPEVLRDPAAWVTHPRYPPLLPALVAALGATAGTPLEDDRAAGPIFAAFLPAFLSILSSEARRLSGRRAAAACVAVGALTPFLALETHGGAAGAFVDFPLAVFLGAATALVARARTGVSEGVVAALLLGAAVLAKNEALPASLAVLGAAAAFAGWRRRGGRAVGLAACGVALAAAALAAHRDGIPNRHDEGYAPSQLIRTPPARLAKNLAAASGVAAGRLLDPKEWGLLWFVLPAALVLGRRGLRGRPAGLLAVATVAPLAVGVLAWSVHWDPGGLARVTASRLAEQGALPALLLLSAGLRPALARRADRPLLVEDTRPARA